jgi:hypothetical protein
MKNRIVTSAIKIVNCFAVLAATSTVNISLPGVAENVENPPIKNNNPCIEELCINDEVKNLSRLNWKKVPASSGTYLVKAVGDPNAIKIFSRYLATRNIDGTGLQALVKIKGFCEKPMELRTSLSGRYTNKKGQLVVVYFSVVPSQDGKTQNFIVSGISKVITKEKVTDEQYNDLVVQAEKKYQNYYQRNNANTVHYPNVRVNSSSLTGTYLQLESQFGQMIPGGVIDPSKFQYFPGCGGDKKINL